MKNLCTIFILIIAFNLHGQVSPKVDQIRFNELSTFQINNLTRFQEGSMVFNSDTKTLWVYKNGSWGELIGSFDLDTTLANGNITDTGFFVQSGTQRTYIDKDRVVVTDTQGVDRETFIEPSLLRVGSSNIIRNVTIEPTKFTFRAGSYFITLDAFTNSVITADRNYFVPNNSGFLTLSVNGQLADNTGNVDIDISGSETDPTFIASEAALFQPTDYAQFQANTLKVGITTAQINKLEAIEDNATADQTGTEIITAIDNEIGTSWKTGGAAAYTLKTNDVTGAYTFVASDTDSLTIVNSGTDVILTIPVNTFSNGDVILAESINATGNLLFDASAITAPSIQTDTIYAVAGYQFRSANVAFPIGKYKSYTIPGPLEEHVGPNAASDPAGNEADSTTGWSTAGATLTSVNTDPQTGSHHMSVVAGDGSLDDARYTFNTENGASYQISIWAREAIGADGRIQLFSNLNGWTTVQLNNTWTNYTQTVTATSTTGTIRIYAASNGAPGDTVYFDNVSITKL